MRYKNKRTLAILKELEYSPAKEAVSPKGRRGVNIYQQGVVKQMQETLMREFSDMEWKRARALIYWGMTEVQKELA